MIIGYASVSTSEQNLGLRHDDEKTAFDASQPFVRGYDDRYVRRLEQRRDVSSEEIARSRPRDQGHCDSTLKIWHGSSRGNSLRGQGLGPLSHKSLVLFDLRRDHARMSTDESVTLVPDDLNHAENFS
jgi:hypothetical protein